ncbi:hypothetical protein JST97_01525 [bacterium]|nr:hypothetical protein [bacterium]
MTELIVACAIGVMLMAIGMLLFRRVTFASLSGSSQLQLQLSTRESLRRMVPLLKMATPPNSQQTAIYSPDIGLTTGNIVFCCPEDLLNPQPPPFDPRDPFYILLQIRYDPSSREVLLEDFYTPTRSNVLAYQVSDFKISRLHRIGLRLQIERQILINDSRGYPKPVKYQLSDVLQLPE